MELTLLGVRTLAATGVVVLLLVLGKRIAMPPGSLGQLALVLGAGVVVLVVFVGTLAAMGHRWTMPADSLPQIRRINESRSGRADSDAPRDGSWRYAFELAHRIRRLDTDLDLHVLLLPIMKETTVPPSLSSAGVQVHYANAHVTSPWNWLAARDIVKKVRPTCTTIPSEPAPRPLH